MVHSEASPTPPQNFTGVLGGWYFGHKEFQVLDQSRSVMTLVSTAQWIFFFFFSNISKILANWLNLDEKNQQKSQFSFQKKKEFPFFLLKEKKHH